MHIIYVYVRSLNEVYHLGDNGPSLICRLSNESPKARHLKPPIELLVIGAKETPKTIQNIDVLLSCLLEIEGETLLLKGHKKNRDATEVEGSFLNTSSHSIQSSYASCQERKAIDSPNHI